MADETHGAIDKDAPLRLADAVALAYPHGGMTVSGLRRERDRGNLEIEKVAGREFTTLNAIEEMRRRCRVQPKAPVCGFVPPALTEDRSAQPNGSSSTEAVRSALAAARLRVAKLSEPLRSTSPQSTSRRGERVIPIKSLLPTS